MVDHQNIEGIGGSPKASSENWMVPLSLRERDRVRDRPIMKSLARKLRRNSTDAERLLWYHLRDRRLAGHKFRRQYVIKPYIVDFVCLETKLIVEIDGSQHIEQEQDDIRRTKYLNSLGYEVVRFWNHEILLYIDNVLDDIHHRLITPSPQPREGAAKG
jgi:very-short-patch-repair endonuclease